MMCKNLLLMLVLIMQHNTALVIQSVKKTFDRPLCIFSAVFYYCIKEWTLIRGHHKLNNLSSDKLKNRRSYYIAPLLIIILS